MKEKLYVVEGPLTIASVHGQHGFRVLSGKFAVARTAPLKDGSMGIVAQFPFLLDTKEKAERICKCVCTQLQKHVGPTPAQSPKPTDEHVYIPSKILEVVESNDQVHFYCDKCAAAYVVSAKRHSRYLLSCPKCTEILVNPVLQEEPKKEC